MISNIIILQLAKKQNEIEPWEFITALHKGYLLEVIIERQLEDICP